MILIIFFYYTVYFNVVQIVMHYNISYKGQGQSITSRSSQGNIRNIFGTFVMGVSDMKLVNLMPLLIIW